MKPQNKLNLSLAVLVATFACPLEASSERKYLRRRLASFAEARKLTKPPDRTESSLLASCCQVGRARAAESARFACKLDARSALASASSPPQPQPQSQPPRVPALDAALHANPSFGEQCELMLESCCMAEHRTRNCDAGKALAKSGAACMDVELSREAVHATESFNDCCMACSLGVLAAGQPSANETAGHQSLAERCKLAAPLDSSFAGLLYEQTYVECCEQSLPRPLGSLVEARGDLDCNQPNACTQKCVPASRQLPARLGRRLEPAPAKDRCDCFAGYKLAADGFTCLDVDECSNDSHTCARETEVCDNTHGGFRCLARRLQRHQSQQQARKPPHKTSDAWPFL